MRWDNYDWIPFKWRLLNYLYTWIRYFKQGKYFDINEDYYCMICGKPVLTRRLCCCNLCYTKAHKEGLF